jgi:5-hydroxyisourate hydrolase
MSGKISTHVLDTARGKPASDVPISLHWQDAPDRWRLIASARTDQDGRCGQLLPAGESLRAGNYRLSFDTGHYFAAQKIAGLYPLVQITFTVREGEPHFHIPLLLGPFGYTTYRGS